MDEIDDLNLLLYAKEKFQISNAAYHELSMLYPMLPRTCQLKKRINVLNEKRTPEGTIGHSRNYLQIELNICYEWALRILHSACRKWFESSSPVTVPIQKMNVTWTKSGQLLIQSKEHEQYRIWKLLQNFPRDQPINITVHTLHFLTFQCTNLITQECQVSCRFWTPLMWDGDMTSSLNSLRLPQMALLKICFWKGKGLSGIRTQDRAWVEHNNDKTRTD